ncbi:MAG: methionyl-tRNA formyltransferase [Comamonadaceae bacterium]|nr:MAG: methionyl-tRNA formyltransferase [Comamonadaceae bacterium]
MASSKSWNQDLANALHARTGKVFHQLFDSASISVEYLEKINSRYVFFPHWSHRIPKEVLDRFECIVFHMTDLPFGRGGSPLQNLIARGIYETKISALKCVEEIDAGPIYLKRPLSLHGAAEEIYLRASKIIEEMIVEIIDASPVPYAQTGDPVFFQRRKPEQGNLLEVKSLEELFDLIRMLDAEGYPHAFININGKRLEFSRAKLSRDGILADVRITMTDEKVDNK